MRCGGKKNRFLRFWELVVGLRHHLGIVALGDCFWVTSPC